MKKIPMDQIVATLRSYHRSPYHSASSSQAAFEEVMRNIPREDQHDAVIALHGYRNQLLAELELALAVQAEGQPDD